MKSIARLSDKQIAKFWSLVDKDSKKYPALENPDLYSRVIGNCWEWKGNIDSCGYGRISFNNKSHRVTRLAMTLYGYEDVENNWVCHHCDNTICLREEHLYLGQPKDNTADMLERGRFNLRAPREGFDGVVDKRYTLTEEDVKEIYFRYWTEENLSQSDLAREYGTDQSNIGFITRGETWNHLTKDIVLPVKLNKECIKDKLTEKDVREIFRLCNAREMSQVEVAKKFNIGERYVNQILQGKKWAHLDLAKTRKKVHEYLTPDIVTEIYTLYWTDKSLSQSKLASIYGVNQGTISFICRGASWVEITSKIDLPNRVSRTR
jgi:predicted XRE-type DNA-binding protein